MAAPAQFTVDGPIARSDLAALATALDRLLDRTGASVVVCRLRGVQATAVALDALARLQLLAARRGCELWLSGASGELRELIAFAGLDEVLRA